MGRFLATTLCALWAWLGASMPVLAEPLRAGVRLAEPADRSLLSRVRGQTGDLEVNVEPVEGTAMEPSFAAELETARALASEHGLRVLMWAQRQEGTLQWVVADFALERVLVRPLANTLEASAQEEAAALIARSALRASLAGTALGQPTEELVEPPPPAAPVVEKVVEPPPPSPRVRPWTFELGAISGIDGVSERGHHALFARASLRWRRLELGVLGGYGIPVAADQPLASLRLAVHRVEGSAGWVLLDGPWRLIPSLAVGSMLFQQHASSRDARLEAQDGTAAALALGAFVRVAYQRRFGLSLRAGFDVLPDAPALGYRASTFTRTQQLWTVQPHLALALQLN